MSNDQENPLILHLDMAATVGHELVEAVHTAYIDAVQAENHLLVSVLLVQLQNVREQATKLASIASDIRAMNGRPKVSYDSK